VIGSCRCVLVATTIAEDQVSARPVADVLDMTLDDLAALCASYALAAPVEG
jgi:hypothetical protein